MPTRSWGKDAGDILAALAAQLANSSWSEAVNAAQEIMFDAWEAEDPKRGIALARKALKVSADCADAYVLLASHQNVTPAECVALYAEGVAAGRRALGEAVFQNDVGEFWGLIETRPYMRALQGLALSLWETGRRDEAVDCIKDMLRLNPTDNQGARYIQISWLLELEHSDAAEQLLKEYERDSSAIWVWSKALLVFRRQGDSDAARAALARAEEHNIHVAPYLTGRLKVPKKIPDYYSPGEKDEAIIYAADAAEIWTGTPGALTWLLTHKR